MTEEQKARRKARMWNKRFNKARIENVKKFFNNKIAPMSDSTFKEDMKALLIKCFSVDDKHRVSLFRKMRVSYNNYSKFMNKFKNKQGMTKAAVKEVTELNKTNLFKGHEDLLSLE